MNLQRKQSWEKEKIEKKEAEENLILKKNSLFLEKGPYLRKNKVSFGEGRKRSQREDGIVGTILSAVLALV